MSVRQAISGGFTTLQRYGTAGPRTFLQQLADNRNVLRFVAGEAHHPRRVAAAMTAYKDALARQDALFLRQRVDDITDAARHANASALVVARLRGAGAQPVLAVLADAI